MDIVLFATSIDRKVKIEERATHNRKESKSKMSICDTVKPIPSWNIKPMILIVMIIPAICAANNLHKAHRQGFTKLFIYASISFSYFPCSYIADSF